VAGHFVEPKILRSWRFKAFSTGFVEHGRRFSKIFTYELLPISGKK